MAHVASTKHAMDHATDKSVLGDFSDATFDYYGVKSRFFRKDGKFFVETDGPDGKLAVFEVKYTFGIDPLQQYLVEFPDGRLQALSLAWDSRPKGQGGQHWFHLYPNEAIKHDDILHWTKLNQNWNFMCAECHSTGVRKNYDAANDRYHTTWAEISVGCETCHGQGSRHLEWARDQESWWPFGKHEDKSKGLTVRFDERSDVTWRQDPRTGNPQRNFAPSILRKEVETCGLCHARRAEFSEDWVPGQWLSDTHVVSELVRGLYHADGQMQEEVYNYGSFKQSKMFAAGVTCSDCHDPHSGKLKASGDGVCLQCHWSDKYATSAHNHHAGAKPPVACASCHMPTHTYMIIDRRHDHSFRIPRPDMSVKVGTPSACNDCHNDKSAEWTASTIASWYGPNREGLSELRRSFPCSLGRSTGRSKASCRRGRRWQYPGVRSRERVRLILLQVFHPRTAIWRGQACRILIRWYGSALSTCSKVYPLLKVGRSASQLLSDPSRGVRIRAASLLAVVPTASQPPADRERFERAAAEFIAAQRLNADRPESRSALGSFLAKRGRPVEAEVGVQGCASLEPAIFARRN